jgi:WD40 repeat protein
VAFSPDGRQVLSGSYDGIVRLWNTDSGKEIAQFVGFNDGEWVVITPDGYYNASANGDKYLNVRIDNNVYGIDQYRRIYYKPQIVEARLQGRDVP